MRPSKQQRGSSVGTVLRSKHWDAMKPLVNDEAKARKATHKTKKFKPIGLKRRDCQACWLPYFIVLSSSARRPVNRGERSAQSKLREWRQLASSSALFFGARARPPAQVVVQPRDQLRKLQMFDVRNTLYLSCVGTACAYLCVKFASALLAWARRSPWLSYQSRN